VYKDDGIEPGMSFLYNQILKVAEFPGERPHNPRNLYLWITRLNFLHSFFIQFYDEKTMAGYQEAENKIKEASKYYPSVKYLVEGFEAAFELFGVIANGYESKGLLLENPEGLRIIYDLVVQLMGFQENNVLNLASILKWQDRLKAVHFILKARHNPQYTREYKIIRKLAIQASTYYPSTRYIEEMEEASIDWLGALSRLLDNLHVVIPENLTFSDRARRRKQ